MKEIGGDVLEGKAPARLSVGQNRHKGTALASPKATPGLDCGWVGVGALRHPPQELLQNPEGRPGGVHSKWQAGGLRMG